MMPEDSSDNTLFSVRNLLSERRANLSSSKWDAASVDVELGAADGASVSILNIRGNHGWFGQNGTIKIPSAFSALIFYKAFGMIENSGKA